MASYVSSAKNYLSLPFEAFKNKLDDPIVNGPLKIIDEFEFSIFIKEKNIKALDLQTLHNMQDLCKSIDSLNSHCILIKKFNLLKKTFHKDFLSILLPITFPFHIIYNTLLTTSFSVGLIGFLSIQMYTRALDDIDIVFRQLLLSKERSMSCSSNRFR
ncbi:MAG: hypothetical protein KR126chlam4_00666 [Candidatus Anoxychlamydiales bacterium]|uniref:Uncharacterized protein n=1 Tax=marine sediment metagenome TaxID=412755 RepID=A0A0F8WVP7_9ZZZZ|nr:hypothetical protein [Candidatus Anoxychlamydiales bacterium]NGX40835.1 hypothetical protein [Candidatus Anoxychlamydiales bacterium]HEU65031.1 hypothetical protein [Chlamydiota bacterium]